MVDLTTTQVETLFGELEYIEPRLKELGVVDIDGEMMHAADGMSKQNRPEHG